MSNSEVGQRFNSNMVKAFNLADHKRNNPKFPDLCFLKTGVGRCLSKAQSGRDWIQDAMRYISKKVTVSRFFDSLSSSRRLKMVKSTSSLIYKDLCDTAPVTDDPFADIPELDNFGIYAADGHYHGTSAHEDLIEGKRYSVGHFFAMNLRTQGLIHLDVARPKNKKEHDITALKRLEGDALRMNELTGRKVIIAYDPAVFDFSQWYKWKKSKGIYIITIMKSNTSLTICGENSFDKKDPRNAGVISDVVGAPNNSHMIRRVIYRDPATGIKYTFLTNEMTLPPGIIAFIYKKRWDIEKVYDEFKNKLMESRAWSKGLNAKCIQAQFMAMTHNLMLLLEREIEKKEGIFDTKIEAKRNNRLKKERTLIKKASREENTLATKSYKTVQRTLQFIRWLRGAMYDNTSWQEEMDTLRPLMEKYL